MHETETDKIIYVEILLFIEETIKYPKKTIHADPKNDNITDHIGSCSSCCIFNLFPQLVQNKLSFETSVPQLGQVMIYSSKHKNVDATKVTSTAKT